MEMSLNGVNSYEPLKKSITYYFRHVYTSSILELQKINVFQGGANIQKGFRWFSYISRINGRRDKQDKCP